MPTYGTIVPCLEHNCAQRIAILRHREIIWSTPLSQLLKRSLLLAVCVIFINLPYGESTGASKTFTDEQGVASVNVVEVVVPMIGGGRNLVYLLTFLVFPSAYLTM